MRLVKYILTFIVVATIGLILFMPKQELYYKAEELLAKQGIVIDNEETISSLSGLKVMHPTAYYQGIDIARASIIDVKPYLLANSLKAENIELLNIAKNFLNVEIATLSAKQSILKPKYIKLDINGSFGIANGYVDLKSKLIHIDIVEPKEINSIKRFLKKGKKGWYYESKI